MREKRETDYHENKKKRFTTRFSRVAEFTEKRIELDRIYGICRIGIGIAGNPAVRGSQCLALGSMGSHEGQN
jgi:hypothetical protein